MILLLAPLVLTLVLLLSSIHTESYAESTYHIKPTPDTPCPAEPCLTLSEYAQSPFLTSNTTLIFLPGSHSLDRDIAVTNVTRFVMVGDSASSPQITSRIVCDGSHLLTFFNISQLHIYFLQITSCGSVTVPAVSVVSVSQVQILGSVFGTASLLVIGSMLNCSGTNFSNSLGTGLVLSKDYVELHSSVFSNNSGGGVNSTNSTLTLTGINTFMNNTADFGGGISATESSIYITGNVTFLDNSAGTSGGGVYLERSILNLTCNGTMTFAGNFISSSDISTGVTGTGGGISAHYSGISLEGNSTFRGNVATDGGGLYLQFSLLNCSGYISFVNNRADGEGGGLGLSSSKGDLEGTSMFISNTAYIAGGGLSSEYSNVSVVRDGRFINNSAKYGGGISIAYGGGLSFIGNNTFVGNWAHEGGGVNVQNSRLISRGNINFTSNLADQNGGGIVSLNSSVKLEGVISFVANTAYYGGGGLIADYSIVCVEGDGRFINNSARYGGGIYMVYGNCLTLIGGNTFVRNRAHQGGGINVENSSLSGRGNITFTNNLADDIGGALGLFSSSVKLEGNSKGCINFTNNLADNFGGGVVSLKSIVKLEGSISFVSNTALYGGGGALYSEHSNVSVEGDGRFRNNSALYGGGIVIAYGGDLTLDGSSTFAGNKAHQGGGINVQNSSLSSRGHINFTNNLADDSGGGLLSINSSVKLKGVSSYVSNTAYYGGGAMYSEHSNVSVEGDGRFVNNSAEYGGGIYIGLVSNLTLEGSHTFGGNRAHQAGGGSIVHNSSLFSRNNISFTNNLADDSGGGLLSINSTVKLEGNSSYTNNTANNVGGGLYAVYSNVSVEGDGRFVNNSAKFGGGIGVGIGGCLTLTGNNTFAQNYAYQDGGGIRVQKGSLSSRGHISFTNNLANDSGGGLMSSNSSVRLERSCSYINNTAYYAGGGLSSEYSCVSVEGDGRFINNSAKFGGGVATGSGGGLSFNGNNTFVENWAHAGGGINVQYSQLISRGNINFTSNLADDGGGVVSLNSSVKLEGIISFVTNTATHGGGGLSSEYSNVSVEGDGRFIHNSAEVGGGIAISDGGILTLIGNNGFIGNKAYQGGGINVYSSSLSSRGYIIFTNNLANDSGGGLASFYSNVRVNGDGKFINNSALYGGGTYIAYGGGLTLDGSKSFAGNRAYQDGGGINVHNSSLCNRGDITFTNNVAIESGGALIVSFKSTVSVEGDGSFKNNSAKYGGGIFIGSGGVLSFNGNNTFVGNWALEGGGINVQNSSLDCRYNVTFTNNVANGCGGGLMSFNSSVQLEGSSSSLHSGYVLFVNNSATCGGGFTCYGTNMSIRVLSMFARNIAEYGGGSGGIFSGSTVTLSGMGTFTQNTAAYGGGVHLVDSIMRFVAGPHFHNNSALYGGGIHGSRAILDFSETVTFTENSATNGGGISLASGSQCLLSSNTTVYLRDNHAEQYGGAIFVADEPFRYCTFRQQSWVLDSREHCFFQPLDLPDPSVHFVLENNTAKETGTALYGGMVDRCDLLESTTAQRFLSDVIFNKTFDITKDKNASRQLVISSEPFHICPCYYDHPNCSQSEVTVTAYPGETFSVSLVAVGQRNGIVPSLIQSTIDGNGASLGDLQYAQSTKNACTPLHYTVSSVNHSVTLTLLADGPCLDLGDSLQVKIDLRSCPVGFQLSEASKQCICGQRLQKYTNSCDIDDLTVSIDGSIWVGLDKTADGIILHSHCPFDYCKSHSVRFTLNETDLQCNYDRTGLLCGGCQPGLSLALGSSHCLQCSHAYLSLLVGFALAGVVLVILLLVFKLTVAVGTINGLIFYANIIAVNQSVFFPSGDTNVVLDILRVFIAWLNLDLGIETCFYDGMDAYARTWLQFIFPVYIWILVCTVIILCYYKTWAVRMFGRNPVAVLATLFLLSYAKLLRTIITALSFTFLDYPDGSEVAVWLYDGNVRYLQGKHIPLFLVAMIVLLLLFLPYTVVLSLGQWIQARSRNRLFSWINNYRVKAFLDAYHGSFKPKHRYWHGLLLVVRSCLFLIFAFNRLGNPNVNLLAIGVCSTALLVLLLLIGGNIYVNWFLQILDISFIANTGVFAATTLYLRHTGGSQAVLVYIFVGTALAMFTGMTICHVTMQMKDSRVWRDIIHPKLQRHQRQWVAVPLEDPVADGEPDVVLPHPHSATFINLRETLLEDSVPDVEDDNRVAESERCIVQRHAQPTQTVVNLQDLIREDPTNNVLPMIELH